MNLIIKTEVQGHYLDVMKRFDLDLFEALKPPLAKMEIVEFSGSEKGDRVHIRFLAPIKSEWLSLITKNGQDENQAYFIDEGEILPFPLKKWKHRHIVQKLDEKHSLIIDDIHFSCANILLTLLAYPALYFSFYPRKRIYKKYFSK